MRPEGALVLLSGGQDSTTTLAWALSRFDHVETIGFDYDQRHKVELACRARIRERIAGLTNAWRESLGDDHMLSLDALAKVSDTALTRATEIAIGSSGLPNTFVPARNLLFLTFAAAVAYRRGLKHLVAGVCETDYSGYPDCRDDTMKALQVALNLGIASQFVIDTPLMWLDKCQTWKLAHDLGGDSLIDLIIEETHTCYQGERSLLHPWGHGCGRCPACELRSAGYTRFADAVPAQS